MSLARYDKKRDFSRTPEPRGAPAPKHAGAGMFVIQKHLARRLHYDFRLEIGGTLKSWAVPKGPSLDPGDKRLAVHVEDHPVEYAEFEGTIPQGEYGGGTVVLWDRGRFVPHGDPEADYRRGSLKFTLAGEKLRGAFTLRKMHGRRSEDGDNWLLIKLDDEAADPDGELLVRERPESALSGRTAEEIAAAPDRVWRSNRAEATGKAGGTMPAKKSTKRAATAGKRAGKKLAKRTGEKAGKKLTKKTAVAGERVGKKLAKKTAATDAAMAPKKLSRKTSGGTAERAPASRAVAPELATLVDAIPTGDDWLHEVKYDGYRLLAESDGKHVRLWTRRGEDWAGRLPWLVEALRARVGGAAKRPRGEGVTGPALLLDGELVHLGPDGVTRFGPLQRALADGADGPLVYFAFDLLFLQGHDLRDMPLERRKQALAELLPPERAPGRVRLSEHIVGQGAPLFDRACKLGLEGVVSKRRDATYRSGRFRDWLKVKCGRRQELVIGGFTGSRSGPREIGALLVGVYDGDRLRYAGKIGTGFDHAEAARLRERLAGLQTLRSPFATRTPDVARSTFVRPELVVEASFTEWTSDGRLRHPVYEGLREDKRAREVRREEPQARSNGEAAPRRTASRPRERDAVEVLGVRISSPDRVLYPDDGVTKRELAEFYARIAEWTVPWIAGRPLSVVRCPEHIEKPCFFQKHPRHDLPAGLLAADLDGTGGEEAYIYLDSAPGLAGLVQIGALEVHMWGSTVERPDDPDWVVFDLDPDPGVPWERVKETAQALRTRLEDLDLVSFLKTTGGKGLHVCLPLTRGKQDWDTVKEFTRAVAREFVRAAPELFTDQSSRARRKGRIFIDYLRNYRGATSVAPYTVRARAGVPVSTPLRWDELAALAGSQAYTLKNLEQRLKRLKRDPWADLPGTRQSLRASVLRAVEARKLAA